MVSAPPTQPLRIHAPTIPTIHDAALHAYPDEACGLLLGVRRPSGAIVVRRAVATVNVAPHEERRHRYQIDPRVLLEWERIAQASGLSIVGYFHSHPDHLPAPSAVDAALAWPTYAYLIVGVVGRDRAQPIVSGMAAWTFEEPSSSFRELPIEVDVGVDEIEYYI